MFSEKFNQKVNESIKILENHLEVIDAIKNLDIDIDLLDKIKKQNERILFKLKNREFEIAVVGLEKAGKSTFINALIENQVLPSAPERCTFTATKLTFGNDEAIVEFFNEEEFNEVFRSMLLDIGYPNLNKVTYDSLSKKSFEEYFNSLEEKNPQLYKMHQGKTNEEIIDIIENKDTIKRYLNKPPQIFKNDELLSSEFQEFIRGEKVGDDTKTGKPRSVKKIEIKSSKLSKLPTAVIYDVPGFDSPTRIHERQTLERLKKADAIVLVTNIGTNPSLRGTELNILLKNSDEDGIDLKDKLFVFGNQLDRAENFEHNKKILLNDVRKYKIAEEKRVIVGSAKQFLIKKGLEKGEVLENFDDGIKKIYKEILNYYENERFNILKNRIEKNREILREIINEVKSNLVIKNTFEEISKERSKIISQTLEEIKVRLKKNLNNLKFELKKEIYDGSYFSQRFKEEIKKEEIFEKIDENFLEDVYKRVDVTATMEYPVEKINKEARKVIYNKFLKELKEKVREITDEKAFEYEKRINEIIAKTVDENIDIKDEVNTFLKDLLNEKRHSFSRFESLIDRFSRNVFDILIEYPLGSVDRKQKFIEVKEEFDYLDNFFDRNGDLIALVLTQDTFKNEIFNLFKSALQMTKTSNNFIVPHLVDIVIDKIDEVLKKTDRSSTKEEVIKEINKDIDSLKKILEKAVIKAANLEFAFYTNFDVQIKTIINSFKYDDENFDKMNEFLSDLIVKLKRDELKAIENIEEENKRKREIKEFLDKIEI